MINRLPNENVKQFTLRLFRNRKKYNLKSQQICDILNKETGNNWTESKYRKWFANYEEGFVDGVESNQSEVLREIKEEQIELQKMKYQTQDQRREYNNLIREQARIDHVKNLLIEEVKKLNETKPLHWHRMSELKLNTKRHGLSLNSDWHKGLFASNNWNEFNDDEFYRRINILTNRTIEFGNEQNISVLHMFLLGDLINGLLHNITRIINTEDAVAQTMSVSETLTEMISLYANEFEFVNLYNARGNHERITQNKKESLAKESFNDLIWWYLKARLVNIPNIKFMENKYDDEIIVADILGYKVFGVHGHKDKVSNVVQNLSLMTREFPDYLCMGHTHHHEENETHSVEIIVNSSFSGVDDYARDIRATSKPCQKFIVFEEGYGRKVTYPIYLK